MEKRSSFLKTVLKQFYITWKEINPELVFSEKLTKNGFTELNIKHKTIKHLENNTGKNLADFGFGDNL